MVAQTMPAAPWCTKIMISTDAGPTSEVSVASLTNPLPRLGTLKVKMIKDQVEFVEMVVGSTLMGSERHCVYEAMHALNFKAWSLSWPVPSDTLNVDIKIWQYGSLDRSLYEQS